MITIKLQGGLGNQMFQYAIGKSLSLKYNTNLLIDDTFNKNRFPQKNLTYRDYELNVFGIEKKLNNISIIFNKISFLNKIVHPYLFNIINKVFNGKRYIKENNGKYIEYIPNNIYLDGFWQTSNYFKDYEEQIKEIFEVKTEINGKNKKILDIINKNYLNTVSVHIRRGDYITNKQANSWHGTCDTNYYLKAIKHIKDNIKEPYFIIFSDDIKWVKNNMDFGNNSLFVEGNDGKGHEDLRLMYSCANHIIANSSFSWWGAYLGKNKNKIVIAPSKWLNNKNYDTSNIIPDNRIKI